MSKKIPHIIEAETFECLAFCLNKLNKLLKLSIIKVIDSFVKNQLSLISFSSKMQYSGDELCIISVDELYPQVSVNEDAVLIIIVAPLCDYLQDECSVVTSC